METLYASVNNPHILCRQPAICNQKPGEWNLDYMHNDFHYLFIMIGPLFIRIFLHLTLTVEFLCSPNYVAPVVATKQEIRLESIIAESTRGYN